MLYDKSIFKQGAFKEMLKEIVTKDHLLATASILKRKRFKAGFDGMTMDGAYAWLSINGERLCRDIYAGDYRPVPAVQRLS